MVKRITSFDRARRSGVELHYEWQTCPSTGKRGFPSERAARASYTGSHRTRIYRCRTCNRWHIAKRT
jgi:hypothetical protein